MRITVSIFNILFVWVGSALAADSSRSVVDEPLSKRVIVHLDPDAPFEIEIAEFVQDDSPSYKLAANIPDNKGPDSSLMGEDRIPAEGKLDAPPVFEEPGPGPDSVEDEINELPPSAEDDYLPVTRPQTKKKAKVKRKYKRKKSRSTKRKRRKIQRDGRKRKIGATAKKTKATRTKRYHGYATLGAPKIRVRRRTWQNEKAHVVGSSYRSRRLQEYKAYTSHIMPFSY